MPESVSKPPAGLFPIFLPSTSIAKAKGKPKSKPKAKPKPGPRPTPVSSAPPTAADEDLREYLGNPLTGDLDNAHLLAMIQHLLIGANYLTIQRIHPTAESLESLGMYLRTPNVSTYSTRCMVLHLHGHFIAARLSRLHTQRPRAELWDSMAGHDFAQVEHFLHCNIPTLNPEDHAHLSLTQPREWEITTHASYWQIDQSTLFPNAASACGVYATLAMRQLAEMTLDDEYHELGLDELHPPTDGQLGLMRAVALRASAFFDPAVLPAGFITPTVHPDA
jgi:hypothetical protein